MAADRQQLNLQLVGLEMSCATVVTVTLIVTHHDVPLKEILYTLGILGMRGTGILSARKAGDAGDVDTLPSPPTEK